MSAIGKNNTARNILRIFGPILLVLGIVALVIGLMDFFSAFNSVGKPSNFGIFFVALPLIFTGALMTGYGYMGAIARYRAGEIAPVAKDTLNYMADGTKDGLKTIASSIKEGLSDKKHLEILCDKCGHLNSENSKYCKHCGTLLRQNKSCNACGKKNDLDASFCSSCGFKFPDQV